MRKELLIEELLKIGIELSSKQINQIDVFLDYLLEKNEETNLTAIRNKEDAYLKHVYDSLTISQVINFRTTKIDNKCWNDSTKEFEDVIFEQEVFNILDIGSGAGFPGIILKIAYPDIHVTLLESNGKKTRFLKEVLEILQLKDIEVINDRAENYVKKTREKFDLVTARAVAYIDILMELSIPFVKPNKFFVAMKGNIETTYEKIDFIAKELGCVIAGIKEFKLPIENSERSLIKIKKINSTSIKYPRAYNLIIKNSLKNQTK